MNEEQQSNPKPTQPQGTTTSGSTGNKIRNISPESNCKLSFEKEGEDTGANTAEKEGVKEEPANPDLSRVSEESFLEDNDDNEGADDDDCDSD